MIVSVLRPFSSFLYNFTLDNSNHVVSSWQVGKESCTEVRNIEFISRQPSKFFVFTFCSLQFKFSVHSCILCYLIVFPSHPFAYLLTSGYLLQTPHNFNFFAISLEGSSYRESTVFFLFFSLFHLLVSSLLCVCVFCVAAFRVCPWPLIKSFINNPQWLLWAPCNHSIFNSLSCI